jgi:hypothetical protein
MNIMLYIDFEAGNTAYKLRLNTRSVVTLEKALGCNPLGIFGTTGEQIPTVTVMVAILHASLQQYQHGITMDKAYDIFDEWLAEGNTTIDFVKIILEIYKASGIVPCETETTEEVSVIEKN